MTMSTIMPTVWRMIMSFRSDFNLFKRTLPSGKKVYYYYIYDDFGKRKQFTTGQTIKKKAFNYCIERLKEDNLVRVGIPTFKSITKDLFIFDKCPIIKQKLIRGEKFSRTNIPFPCQCGGNYRLL